ncbi:hypothetical protein C5167_014577 [Papaver somniferum]|uniref:Protein DETOXIFICATION n=1 Tax=Papaver somniferum TaxID=3469 RepID=A0A4Y7J6Q1_PAPSO|nr:hypothetical protein C5167_014577 [Papaver somniferum]
MEIKTLNLSSHSPFRNPNNRRFYPCSSSAIVAHFPHYLPLPQLSHISSILTSSSFRANQRFRISCITPIDQNLIETPNDLTEEDSIVSTSSQVEVESDPSQGIISSVKEGINVEIVNDSIWMQIKEIALFAGPAAGLWLCGPLMSLIDTAIIGQGSSLELAALGPATVVCDYLSYVFMFLSIATSNMVATSLATGDKNDVQHKISILLFVGFACGLGMLLLTKFLGIKLLSGFTGAQNLHLVPAANTYVQIRGLAWPAILVGWVTQSARYGYSSVVAAFMMIGALKNKGYNAFSIAIPSAKELLQIFELAAPVFVTMISKVAFYSFLAYFATSMGTRKIAAHQARMLLKSLLVIGAIAGAILGVVGTSVPWLFPNLFTTDAEVIGEMHKVLLPYLIALIVTPSTHSLEGTLLAGRDLRFLSISMSGCFTLGGLLVLLVSNRGFGLAGCWWSLAAFQWARFFLALSRLTSPTSFLQSDKLILSQVEKVKTT